MIIMGKFKTTDNKGFQITFDNGYTISCQFGSQNYCENYRNGEYRHEMNQSITECEDCEVAIWDSRDNWITGDIVEKIGMESTEPMVQARVNSNEVAKIISYIVAL